MELLKLKPLLKPCKCEYQVGLSPSGFPIYCPIKADIRVDNKPMCWKHVKEIGDR